MSGCAEKLILAHFAVPMGEEHNFATWLLTASKPIFDSKLSGYIVIFSALILRELVYLHVL